MSRSIYNIHSDIAFKILNVFQFNVLYNKKLIVTLYRNKITLLKIIIYLKLDSKEIINLVLSLYKKKFSQMNNAIYPCQKL